MVLENLDIGQAFSCVGISRRRFLQFCGLMAATLALPACETEVIAEALEATTRVPVIWLEFQDCTGDTESFLRASPRPDPLVSGVTDPSITDLILNKISVNYHETIMAPSGYMAEKSRADTWRDFSGQYLCIVEGSIPTAANGIYCTVGGRTALSILQEMTGRAAATIALGTCAFDGGLAGAVPNPTGAMGVRGAIPSISNLVSLPGCPANVVNLVAVIVYYLTYRQLPPRDGSGRPSFAYHEEIHEECERHDHYEHDRFVWAWGDQGHRQGWCLRKMGCRGPDTKHNCPTAKWNSGACWPVAAGHGCVGCAQGHFWDNMTPFYTSQGGNDDD